MACARATRTSTCSVSDSSCWTILLKNSTSLAGYIHLERSATREDSASAPLPVPMRLLGKTFWVARTPPCAGNGDGRMRLESSAASSKQCFSTESTLSRHSSLQSRHSRSGHSTSRGTHAIRYEVRRLQDPIATFGDLGPSSRSRSASCRCRARRSSRRRPRHP
jgi:hypothetical protein